MSRTPSIIAAIPLIAASVTVMLASNWTWDTVVGTREDGFASNGDSTFWMGLIVTVAGVLAIVGFRARLAYLTASAASAGILLAALAARHDVLQVPKDAGLATNSASIGVGMSVTLWAGSACLAVAVTLVALTSRSTRTSSER